MSASVEMVHLTPGEDESEVRALVQRHVDRWLAQITEDFPQFVAAMPPGKEKFTLKIGLAGIHIFHWSASVQSLRMLLTAEIDRDRHTLRDFAPGAVSDEINVEFFIEKQSQQCPLVQLASLGCTDRRAFRIDIYAQNNLPSTRDALVLLESMVRTDQGRLPIDEDRRLWVGLQRGFRRSDYGVTIEPYPAQHDPALQSFTNRVRQRLIDTLQALDGPPRKPFLLIGAATSCQS